jgi:hypothetical protein
MEETKNSYQSVLESHGNRSLWIPKSQELKWYIEKVRFEVLNIALMMEAASGSETSVNFYQTTRRNNPEDSHLH